MQTRRKIGHLSTVVTVGVAAAGTASATSIHTGSATGPYYTGPVSGTSLGNVQISSSSGLGTVTCTGATLNGSVNAPNPVPSGSVTTPITSASFSTCSKSGGGTCSASPSGLSWSGATTWSPIVSGRDATLGLGGQGISVICGSITCNYGTTGSTSDFFNPSNPFRPNASAITQVAVNTSMSIQSGSSGICATSATWSGLYGLLASNVGPIVAAEL
jgi:hypothetical protein